MLQFLIYFSVFLLGLAVGSFLNSVIYRLETNRSFFRGRSFCPKCRHQLSWPDLIPLFSFLFLKGRCGYCKKDISWQYPLVELATGALFLLITIYHLPFTIYPLSIYHFSQIIFLFALTSFLIIIFVYDLKHYIIPDKAIYPAIGLVSVWRLLEVWNLGFVSDFGFLWLRQISRSESISDFSSLLNPLFSAILASAFFLAIVFFSRGKWMGMGDVKLAALMGLFLGWPNLLPAFFLAFLLGSLAGIWLIFLGRKKLKSEVPFGPFLVAGTFISLFWGKEIINWYFGLAGL